MLFSLLAARCKGRARENYFGGFARMLHGVGRRNNVLLWPWRRNDIPAGGGIVVPKTCVFGIGDLSVSGLKVKLDSATRPLLGAEYIKTTTGP